MRFMVFSFFLPSVPFCGKVRICFGYYFFKEKKYGYYFLKARVSTALPC
jgi:hypothetical protein